MNDTMSSMRWRGASLPIVPALPSVQHTAAPTASSLRTVRLAERALALQSSAVGASAACEPHFVPTLQSLCARVVAQNFASVHEVDALRRSDDAQCVSLYEAVLAQLPLCGASDAPPLRVAVARVSSEAYWRRCCEARWSLGELSRFASDAAERVCVDGGVAGLREWKRLYLEHTLADFLRSLRPRRSERDVALSPAAAHAATLAAVHTPQRIVYSCAQTTSMTALRASSAPLASACAVVSGAVAAGDANDDGDGDDADVFAMDDDDVAALHELCAACRDYVTVLSLPSQRVHLRLHDLLCARLPLVHTLHLTYDVRSVGVQYERHMRGFARRDAHEMRQLLCHHRALRTLRLPGNSLHGDCLTAVLAGAVVRNALQTLDLSSNALDDDDACNVALLLCDGKCALATLLLRDNHIAARGASALADALTSNTTLRVLDVSQNRIPDADGGAVLVRALAQHDCVTQLDLSNNRLGAATVAALHDTLPRLRSLTHLALTGNVGIGVGGGGDDSVGAMLYEAVTQSSSLRRVDARCCSVHAETLARIDAALRSRVRAAHMVAATRRASAAN